MEEKTNIINRIEAQQWDYEKELKIKGIDEVKENNLIMRKVEGSDSIYSNKVVKSIFKDDIEKNIDCVFNFFKDKPFSWWVGPNARPLNLKERLKGRGMEIIDEYVGLAFDIDTWRDREISTPYFITRVRNEKDIKEHVNVSKEIWNLSEDAADAALKQRFQYFKLPTKRGDFIVALDGDKGVGNATYRLSEDGQTMYLTGSAVLPSYRKKGIYSELVRLRLNLAKDMGAGLVTVQARKGTSEPILRKLGFKEYGTFYLLKKE